MKILLLGWVLLFTSFALAEDFQQLSKERIVFRTNVGDIVVALYPIAAPQHAAQIIKMAKVGIYDGTAIFRVEKGFVAQVENYDRHSPMLSEDQWSKVVRIPAEFNSIHHRRGILSMARLEDPNTAEASFSFVLGEAPHLDNKYTVFGEVVEGMDVLDRIEEQPTNKDNSPQKILEIMKTEVLDDGDLSKVNLIKAHPYQAPNEASRQWFLFFAFSAFAITILWPILKTAFEKTKA